MFGRKTISASVVSVAVLFACALVLAGFSPGEAAAKKTGKVKKAGTTQPAVKTFSKDSDCSACHRPYVESMKNDKTLLSKHADVTKDCFSCHKEGETVAAHAGVTKAPGKLFRQRRYPNDLCVACHGGYAELVEKTKDSTAFKTVHGTLINPHKTHVGQVECYNCHKMHKDRPPIEYCYGCHHPRQLSNCKDCHAPKKE